MPTGELLEHVPSLILTITFQLAEETETSRMTSGSSLVVPMVMWGPRAPTHCISAIYLLRDQRTLVSGAADGQVRSCIIENLIQPFKSRVIMAIYLCQEKCSTSKNLTISSNIIWPINILYFLRSLQTVWVDALALSKVKTNNDSPLVRSPFESFQLFGV